MTIRYPKSRLRQIIFIAAHVAAVTFILLWLWYMLGSHLVAHYFDLGRHEAISTMAWEAIKTNIGANLYVRIGRRPCGGAAAVRLVARAARLSQRTELAEHMFGGAAAGPNLTKPTNLVLFLFRSESSG